MSVTAGLTRVIITSCSYLEYLDLGTITQLTIDKDTVDGRVEETRHDTKNN